MKVIITYRLSLGMGGVANYFRVLKPHFPNNIEYFVFQKKQNESNMGDFKHLVKDYFKFKRTINNYDIIHINPSLRLNAIIRDGILIRTSKKKGKKVVVFFRGWDDSFEKKIIRKRWLWLFKKYYFKADAIIVLAEKFKESLIKMEYKGRIFVETTAVDDYIIPSNIDRANNEKIPVNILFLARVTKEKGVYEAIDAVNQLRLKGIEVDLTVAGDGAELGSAKNYVADKRISGINFKGYIRSKDKIEAFLSSDIYLLPSHHGEGMPNSLLEAMAFGLPIITRPVGGIKDFFEANKMGYITDSSSPIEFANLIEKLIYNPELRKQIGKYNHDYANKRFKASIVAERLESIYKEILNL